MLLGLGLILGGFFMGKDKKQKNNSGGLQDVVYLKNGSVIRGTIIEQVPNVQIKIKTSDGSIFVYKIEEIEKMTKEEAPN